MSTEGRKGDDGESENLKKRDTKLSIPWQLSATVDDDDEGMSHACSSKLAYQYSSTALMKSGAATITIWRINQEHIPEFAAAVVAEHRAALLRPSISSLSEAVCSSNSISASSISSRRLGVSSMPIASSSSPVEPPTNFELSTTEYYSGVMTACRPAAWVAFALAAVSAGTR